MRAHLLILLRNERGAIGLEYALVLPFLILLIIGLVDYGGLAYRETQLEAAVRSGGQYALVDGNSSDVAGIEAVVYEAMGLDPDSGALSFAISYEWMCPDGTAAISIGDFCGADDDIPPGYFMRLGVSETYQMWVPYPLLPETHDITGEVMIRVLRTS
jgi:Flp pilus assembly pilin Flp